MKSAKRETYESSRFNGLDDGDYERWWYFSSPQKCPWYWETKIAAFYDPKKCLPRFETVEKCREKQSKRIRDLHKGDIEMQHLAVRLENCRKNQRCGSPACCFCMRQYRRWHVAEGLEQLHGVKPLFHATLILEEYALQDYYDVGRINDLRKTLMKQVERKLPDYAIVCGWIEVSFEADVGAFVPHLHALIGGCSREELRALKPSGSRWKGRKVFRPLVLKCVDRGKEMECLSYTVKQFPPGYRRRNKKAAFTMKLSGRINKGSTIEAKRLVILGGCKTEQLSVFKGVKRDRNGKHLRRSAKRSTKNG